MFCLELNNKILKFEKSSYLNKKSFTLTGTMLFEPEIGACVSLLLKSTNSLLIASISAIISNAFSQNLSRFKSFRHCCSIFWSGSSKQEVMISPIWSLPWPTLIMEPSSSSSSLSALLQKVSDLMMILWHTPSWSNIFSFKRNDHKLIN